MSSLNSHLLPIRTVPSLFPPGRDALRQLGPRVRSACTETIRWISSRATPLRAARRRQDECRVTLVDGTTAVAAPTTHAMMGLGANTLTVAQVPQSGLSQPATAPAGGRHSFGTPNSPHSSPFRTKPRRLKDIVSGCSPSATTLSMADPCSSGPPRHNNLRGMGPRSRASEPEEVRCDCAACVAGAGWSRW